MRNTTLLLIAIAATLVTVQTSFAQDPMSIVSGTPQTTDQTAFSLVLSDPNNQSTSGYQDWQYATDGYGNPYNSYSATIAQSGYTYFSSAGTSIGASDGYGNRNLTVNMAQSLVPSPGSYDVLVQDSYSGSSWSCTGCMVFNAPTCPQPTNGTATNITNSTAELGWTEAGSATSWDIEWGTSGFTPTGVPNVSATTSNPHSLSGLAATTGYQFYVRARCGVGDLSTWSGPYNFFTTQQCNIVSGSPELNSTASFSLLLSDPYSADEYSAFRDFRRATDGYGALLNNYTTTLENGGVTYYTSSTETLQSIDGYNYNLLNQMNQNSVPAAGNFDVHVYDSYSGVNWWCAGCFSVVSPPANDQPCSASVLSFGVNGPFSSLNATNDSLEVVPPATGCNTQDGWCNLPGDNEPGVQSSTWYQFVAPASGNVTLNTDSSSFDTQIAVYSANSCSDLSNGSATLIGANDDNALYNYTQYSSELTVTCLTPGQTYYVQVDGFDGAAGNVMIRMTDNLYRPQAEISAGSQAVCIGGSVQLNAVTSGLTYLWNTGDTTQAISVGSAGTYILTMWDANGCESMDTISLSSESVPVAAFGSSESDYTAQFTDMSTGSVNSMVWDFGDGNTSSMQNPTHTYASAGVYTVCLIVVNNCGADSVCQSVEIGPCSNPNTYSVSDIQTDEVTISWNSQPEAIQYKLKIRPVGSSSWTFHTILAPDTFKVKGNLMAGTDYEYKVKTICNYNSPGGYGGFQYFTTESICQNPDSVTMVGVNQTQTNASWTPVSGAIYYKLKYRPVGSGTWKYKTVYAPQTSRNLYNLLPDTEYEYKIRTVCGNGNVPYGSTAYFSTLACDIAPNRNESVITQNTAILSWDPVPGAVSYKVKYRINNTANWSYRNITAPTSSVQLLNLQGGTTYQWKVKTFCSPGSNYSSYSGNNLFSTMSLQGEQLSRLAAASDETLDDIIVYPNPTSHMVTLRLGDTDGALVKVRNVNGQVIHRESLQDVAQMDLELPDASGLYMIEVLTDVGQRKVFKVIKE